jgi:DNA-binding MarR family transcriptional regulator
VAPAARWLTDAEQRTWRAFLEATQRLNLQLDRELWQQAGMPLAYYQILAMLSEVPDRSLRMSELAAITQSSQSRLSHAIARLERKGWVRRKPCPEDRRSTFAQLTEEGFAALAAAAPGHVRTVRRYLFDRLTPEQVDQLHEITRAVLEGLGVADGDARDVLPG